MSENEYDLSHWPVAIVKVRVRPMTTPEFQTHLAKISTFYERGRFALVLDVRGSPDISASERAMVAKSFDDDTTRFPGRLAGLACVMSSPVQRGIFKAVSWLTRSTFEREAFSALEPAMKWGRECVLDEPASGRRPKDQESLAPSRGRDRAAGTKD